MKNILFRRGGEKKQRDVFSFSGPMKHPFKIELPHKVIL